jgi:hypothetical protein
MAALPPDYSPCFAYALLREMKERVDLGYQTGEHMLESFLGFFSAKKKQKREPT